MKKTKLITIAFALIALLFASCDKKNDDDVKPIINELSYFTVSRDTIWSPKTSGIIVINGTLTINSAKLTIKPGTILKFKTGARVVITGQNAELIAVGKPDSLIVFTSASETPLPGDWSGIEFKNNINTTTKLEYCKIEYAGDNLSYGSVYLNEVNITMNNCEISKSQTYGIVCSKSGFNQFINNKISECGNGAIKIAPNFVHTIGYGNQIAAESYIEVTGGTFNINQATWYRQTVPYVLAGSLSISGANNPILTIQKGTELQLKNGNNVSVGGSASYGTLIAKGTADSLISFTSFSTTPQTGDWDYIMFKNGSTNCILEYCDIKYGGGNQSYGMIDVTGNAIVSIKNCQITESKYYPVSSKDTDNAGFVEFSDNTITSTTGNVLRIYGKLVHTIGLNNTFNAPENNGILVTGSSESYNYITKNTTWKAQNCAYIIEDDIVIKNNSELNIEAGSVLKFLSGVHLQVGSSTEYGRLVAEGTSTKKIIFTSSSSAPQKGDWGSIRFMNQALSGSILNYCEISYGGSSTSYKGNIVIYPCGSGNPSIKNCNISNSKYFGIYKKKTSGLWGDPTLLNNTYSNNESGEIGQDN